VHPTLSKKNTRVPRDGRPSQRNDEASCFTALASLQSAPLTARPCALHAGQDASRTDVWRPCRLPASSAVMPNPPSGRSCFPRRLVNDDVFHSYEHLPPASSRPPTLPIPAGLHRPHLLDTVRPRLPFLADFLLWARPPWAPSAATDDACLNRVSLTGFCNHAKNRTHRANVRTSPRNAVSGASVARSSTELRVSGKRQVGSRCTRRRDLPAEVSRVSVRAAATEANSDLFERPVVAE